MVIDPLTRKLLRRGGRHGPVMLMYHALTTGKGTARWPWAVSLGRFLEHVDLLRSEGWQTRTMRELASGSSDSFPEKTVVITFDDGFANNLDAVDSLVAHGMTATWFIVTGAIGRAPHWEDAGRPPGSMLSAEDLREMHTAGMEIGSHTVNHIRLPEISDAALASELNDSKRTLEDLLGTSVESFAYPYGDWNEHCEAAVKLAGYRQACTTRTGAALKDRNRYRLRRLAVFNHDTCGNLARKLVLMTNEGDWGRMLAYYGRRLAGQAFPLGGRAGQ